MSADDAWNDPGWKQAALDHVDQVKKDANGKTGNDLGAILGRKIAEQRAEQEARIKEMAARDPIAYDQSRRKWAKDLGIRTATLDTEVQKRRRHPAKKPSDDEAEDKIKDFELAAGDLIPEPDVLARFGETVQAGGLVGETRNAKILYLAQTSRLFERPVSIAIKGVSAGGKSFTVESVLRFFPPEAYFERTGMSEHALPYSDEDFQHRHIVVYEHAGMDSGKVAYFIRTLLSENRINYETVEKTDEGLKSRLIEKAGPTGIITTTTSAALHPENETRLLSLGVVDSPEQTAAVMRVLGIRAASGGKPDDGEQPVWVAYQRWLALGETRVVVPFAITLSEKVPPLAVRLRRDFEMLLTLISAHALLHRGTRAADQQGRVVATVDDYAAVHDLVASLFAEGLEATVRPVVRETVEAVRAMGEPEVSLTSLARVLNLDKATVHNRVKKAIASGFLVNHETKPGMPRRIVLGDPLPQERQILPDPGVLQEGCWGVGKHSEGVRTESQYSGELPLSEHAETAKSPGIAPKSTANDEKQPETGRLPADAAPETSLYGHPPPSVSNTPTPNCQGNGPTDRAISNTSEDRREPEPACAKVTIREISPPAISAGPDDDLLDIDPGWRQ